MKVVRLSDLRTGRLYPRKYSWYSFLLGAESTSGLNCGQEDYVIEKFQRHYRELNQRPQPVPQPTASPRASLVVVVVVVVKNCIL